MVTFTDDDEGKKVVNQNGEDVGRVVDVRHATAYVDPDPGMFETVKSKLGWGDVDDDEDVYPLQDADVESVDDDRVLLRRL
ncbi:PRC-barrel domain-containing protein [Candidatus Halobonum tyrrellensis]|uniref:PRC-barrel domain-containing protein n=1 Tax=Candidatus Halobonum tyrrellensis G22 TaxID=1324957 RepID=V4IUL4_9EURY|nr:PRC-barrel domain-containing protein [Candidatus Halobonum tyrrellensis]ESP86877.1 hypothetical protein K933_16487 [Candidatus Halobonum tyrrellensis G22]